VAGGEVGGEAGGRGGVDLIQTKQKRAAREQRNKYKPRTESRTTPSNQTLLIIWGGHGIMGVIFVSFSKGFFKDFKKNSIMWERLDVQI
jgi:hypothetical protein